MSGWVFWDCLVKVTPSGGEAWLFVLRKKRRRRLDLVKEEEGRHEGRHEGRG